MSGVEAPHVSTSIAIHERIGGAVIRGRGDTVTPESVAGAAIAGNVASGAHRLLGEAVVTSTITVTPTDTLRAKTLPRPNIIVKVTTRMTAMSVAAKIAH